MAERGQRSAPADLERATEDWERRKERLLRPPILVGAREMRRAATSETPFLVANAIPAGAITLMVGEPGAKKSWLAYSLALAVAQGREWLGRPVTPKGATSNVLVLNYDNPTSECGRRFVRLGMRDADPLHFHSVDTDPLRLPAASDDLLALAHALRPSLVLVDSLRQAHTSDENSSQEMAIVMSSLKQLRSDGCAVIVVHHASKGQLANPGATGTARGSGEIKASADAEIFVGPADYEDSPELRGADVAVWTKHRTWAMTPLDESMTFAVVDVGDRTEVTLFEGT